MERFFQNIFFNEGNFLVSPSAFIMDPSFVVIPESATRNELFFTKSDTMEKAIKHEIGS